MRFVVLVLFAAWAGWPILGAAQNTVEVQKIADTMVRLCVDGGRLEVISRTITGGTDLSLRSFDVKGNVKDEFEIKKVSVKDLIDGLDNASRQVTADQADRVEVCLQPVRERWLAVPYPEGLHDSPERGGAVPLMKTTPGSRVIEKTAKDIGVIERDATGPSTVAPPLQPGK